MSVTRGAAPGAAAARRRSIAAVSSGWRAASRPPPRTTGIPSAPGPVRPSRRMAVTAMAVTSSASRSSRSRAAVSPAEAVSKSTVVRPSNSALAMRPRWTPMATSRTVGRPKYAAVAGRSKVSGPRPSSARIAHHMTSWPRYQPPPQSPVSRPSARNRVVRPSGARPAQLMPAPQVTADAPGRLAWGRREPGAQHGERVVGHGRGQRPAPAPQRLRELLLLLGQVGVGQAGRDMPGDRPLGSRPPACAAASATISPSIRMAPSTPWCSWLVPGPAHRGEQRAVRGDERDVGLAVPAVDGQHRGQRG